MELTGSLKALFIETSQSLQGNARRLFMARTVKELRPGGQRRAERERDWDRVTIRKGTRELASGIICLEAFAARGRKRVEVHLPQLGDVTIVLSKKRRNFGPRRVKIIVTNLLDVNASVILNQYAIRWAVKLTIKELKRELHLGCMAACR